MSNLNKLVGIKIKQKRLELGVTQMELGAILGCTFQLIQHYESGFCQIPIDRLSDFALLCRLPVDWFLLDENELLVLAGPIPPEDALL